MTDPEWLDEIHAVSDDRELERAETQSARALAQDACERLREQFDLLMALRTNLRFLCPSIPDDQIVRAPGLEESSDPRLPYVEAMKNRMQRPLEQRIGHQVAATDQALEQAARAAASVEALVRRTVLMLQ